MEDEREMEKLVVRYSTTIGYAVGFTVTFLILRFVFHLF